MNKLNIEERTKIITALVGGNSIRATCRMTGAAKRTVIRLLESVGKACSNYQNEHLKNLNCKNIQIDEIWSFCYAKDKNVPENKKGQFDYGDLWTFSAIDAETKLVPCWLVGKRDADYALEFVNDLKDRLSNRAQITTDGHRIYLIAVEKAFGSKVDCAMLVKMYGPEPEGEKRYSSSDCAATEKQMLQSNPDPSKITTSYVI